MKRHALFRWRPRGASLAAALALLAGAYLVVSTPATASPGLVTTVVSAADHYSVVVRRTSFGIPHVEGASFGDVGYGYGYAFAQDDLCALADLVVTADGDRSRFYGPDADTTDLLFRPMSNLDSDVFHRWIGDSGVVGRTYDQPAPLGLTAEVRQMIDGYVAGVNRYLANTGAANLPDPTCRAKPWVHPISAAEIEHINYVVTQIGGIANMQAQIAEATPAADPPGRVADLNVNPSDSGSNGLAVGRTGTRTGGGLLMANPHLPWIGGGRFYQAQLTIPGRLDVTGGSLYGTPLIEIGHNQNVAWTHTTSTAQRFTYYELHLVPGDPTSYLVDGRAERMGRVPVSVPLPGGGTTTRTVFTSRYGPVLNMNWTPTTAIAVRGASVNNGRSLNEWLAMGRAGNVAELRAAQRRYQSNPFNNTIATDAHGTAYFADSSVVPNVTDDETDRCVDSPLGRSLLPRILLDGSVSSCAWGNSPDAVIPGIFGPSAEPTLTRDDFVTNSNDSFWLTNPAAPITGVPRIYGDTGTERRPRTRMGLTVIDERQHGTDGLGAPGFTVSTTERALLGDRNLSAELARDATVALCRATPTLTATDGTAVDVSAACPVLAAWDGRDDPDSRGAVLWRQYWFTAFGSENLWTVPFDPAHPVTTPNTLNTADPGVRQALADAVERMRALHLPLDEPLSAAQRTDIGGGDVPVPGCTNAEGCYNIVDGVGDNGLADDGRFPTINAGSGFMMVADMSPRGPSAATLVTYSESANPASPHHGDQTALFGARQWVTDRFTQREILADPHLTITVLAGR